MPRDSRRAKRGDVRSLVKIESPDDVEIAAPPGEGDSDTLVAIDSPDDADVYPEGGPPKKVGLGASTQKRKSRR